MDPGPIHPFGGPVRGKTIGMRSTESGGAREEDLRISAGTVWLAGRLTMPAEPRGLVLFAHGSGSGRHSPRNRWVAESLHRSALATLLFDLLDEREEGNRAAVFDIELLAARLLAATAHVRDHPLCLGLPVGYFGASTGAAAALVAAADPGARVAAVVSRGGRPDLARSWLRSVRVPTLLIVGGLDRQVLELNRRAQETLAAPTRLEVVPGATHLFEEPGALDRVATLARAFFLEHLADARPGSGNT